MPKRVVAVLFVSVAVAALATGEQRGQRGAQAVRPAGASAAALYARSFALVIGVNEYPLLRRGGLRYARKDAEAVAHFLRSQGFDVAVLYDKEATRTAIISKMQSLARHFEENDRVLFFFAGHGHTDHLGQQDHGYIVPYDGDADSATYISMEELRAQSQKMANAKHQLFIMDACYGGLLQPTRSIEIPSDIPDYLVEVSRRRARQILTAGGPDQQVLDAGPGGHSVFTAHLLRGLGDGLADLNGDGAITFSELSAYILPAATKPGYQTPGSGILPGHEQGEFWFRSPVAPLGFLILNALPWAQVTKIVGADGKDWAAGASRFTPLALRLPVGRYSVSFTNPQFSAPITTTVTVEPNRSEANLVEFARIDPVEYFKKAGF